MEWQYSHTHATFSYRVAQHKLIVLDEMDADNLLRVIDNATSEQAWADLTEFFETTEDLNNSFARKVAKQFIDQANQIADHVYA